MTSPTATTTTGRPTSHISVLDDRRTRTTDQDLRYARWLIADAVDSYRTFDHDDDDPTVELATTRDHAWLTMDTCPAWVVGTVDRFIDALDGWPTDLDALRWSFHSLGFTDRAARALIAEVI